ncbi:MAG: hypothetical protein QG620_639 [Patescibacteria group bacterium]|nr:hypothetical protein [Patescibacteria group bacterium]
MIKYRPAVFVLLSILLIPVFGYWFWREIIKDSSGKDVLKSLSESQSEETGNLEKSLGAAVNQKQAPKTPSYPKTAPNNNPAPTPASNPVVESSLETENKNESESAGKDEKEDWKTHKSEEGGFEFKYPADAAVKEAGSYLAVTQNGKTWRLRVYENESKQELETWYAANFSEKERKNCTLGSGEIKIGTYETKYAAPGSGDAVCQESGCFAANANKDKIIRVKMETESAESVNKILETFQFTD